MPGIGIITNVVAILLGGLLGLGCGRFISERFQETPMRACALAVIFLGLGRTLSGRDRAHHNTCGTREPQLHRQHPHLLRRHEPPRSAAHPRRKLPPRSRHCRPLAGGIKSCRAFALRGESIDI